MDLTSAERPGRLTGRVAGLYDRSLGWLVTNLGLVGAPAGSGPGDRVKDLGELAMLYRLAKRFPRSARHDHLQQIRRHVAAGTPTDATGKESFLDLLRTALALDACDAGLEPCLREFRLAFAQQSSWAGWNLVELKYYLDILRIENGLPPFRELLPPTLIRPRPDIRTLRRFDVYELTHTLFSISDFGRCDVRPVLGAHVDEVRDHIERLIVHFLNEHEWDLVAELLIGRLCLGGGTRPVIDQAWEGLIAAQLLSGGVPLRRSGAPDSTGEFALCYHTTVVTVMAAMLEVEPA